MSLYLHKYKIMVTLEKNREAGDSSGRGTFLSKILLNVEPCTCSSWAEMDKIKKRKLYIRTDPYTWTENFRKAIQEIGNCLHQGNGMNWKGTLTFVSLLYHIVAFFKFHTWALSERTKKAYPSQKRWIENGSLPTSLMRFVLPSGLVLSAEGLVIPDDGQEAGWAGLESDCGQSSRQGPARVISPSISHW